MKVNNENFDKVLNKLVASTRSPRGRFTAENSWRLLESRLLKRRSTIFRKQKQLKDTTLATFL